MPVSVARKPVPAQSRARKPPPPPAAPRPTREENVRALWDTAGALLILRGNYADAGAISMHSAPITREVVRLADQDEKIGKLIDQLGAVGPFGGLLMAVLPFAMQVAANHGRIDASRAAGFGNIMEPADLEKRIRLEMEQARRQWESELAELQKEQEPKP
jgi:hypothetical protein